MQMRPFFNATTSSPLDLQQRHIDSTPTRKRLRTLTHVRLADKAIRGPLTVQDKDGARAILRVLPEVQARADLNAVVEGVDKGFA